MSRNGTEAGERELEPAEDHSPTVGERFNVIYSGTAQNPTLRRAQRQAYGDEYPEEVRPFSLLTRSDLRRIAQGLGVGPGQRMVDLACGEGGAGLWVARETGADLVGVDVSSVAVQHARARVAEFGLEGRASFQVGDFVATGLPAHAFDGAMSIDALWLVPDKSVALREVVRILRPGTRFIFTTWDFAVSPPDDSQISDHRPLLAEAGFAVETYEETENWEGYYRALVAEYEAARDDLVRELGETEADEMLAHYRRRAALLPGWRRIRVVARKSEA